MMGSSGLRSVSPKVSRTSFRMVSKACMAKALGCGGWNLEQCAGLLPGCKGGDRKKGAFLFLLNGAMNAMGSLLSLSFFPLKLGRAFFKTKGNP